MTGPNLNYDIPVYGDVGGPLGWVLKLLKLFRSAESAARVNAHAYLADGEDADGVADNTTALTNAYAATKALGANAVMDLGSGTWLHGPLDWDSNKVGVEGAGSGSCKLVPLASGGTITIRPATFTVTQGPKIAGFTIEDNPAHTAGEVGFETGDITKYHFEDIVWQDFIGAGSIGRLVTSAEQTELTRWINCHENGNTIGTKWLSSDPAKASLARNNHYGHHLNVNNGQIGWQMRGHGVMYGSHIEIGGNMDGAGTFFDIGANGDAVQMKGHFELALEQTGGTGGVSFHIGDNGYVLGNGSCEEENTLIRIVPATIPNHLYIAQAAAVPVGDDYGTCGQIANFHGANAANIHPGRTIDHMAFSLAGTVVLTGDEIASMGLVALNATDNGIIFFRKDAGADSWEDLVETLRVDANGGLVTSLEVPPALANAAGLGAGAPTPASAGGQLSGTISLGTGTSPAAGDACTLTWAIPGTGLGEVHFSPLSGPAALAAPYTSARSSSSATLALANAPIASQPLGAYVFSYTVIWKKV